ncbi:Nuclear protein STH1/NPS1 [Yarrowia sp. B02]|nr:Nuclear protein STH1/NPS1 [Yarrowia sp. B02]
MDLENGHSPAANGATLNGSAKEPQVFSIPNPESVEQAQLLFLRFNALNANQDTSPELEGIVTRMHTMGKEQQLYAKRLEEVNAARKTAHNKVDLDLLRTQVNAFRYLSRGLDMPTDVQERLMATVGLESNVSEEEADAALEKSLTPYQRRLKDSGVPPRGGFVDNGRGVGGRHEFIITNRISQRILELESLPSNLGVLDASQDDLGQAEGTDALKVRAVAELKALRLLTKQKSLRQHLVYCKAQTSQVTDSVINRALNRRAKVQTAHEMRLTEQLERQQRMERERKQRDEIMAYVNSVCHQSDRIREEAHRRRTKQYAVAKGIQQFHSYVEREESRRAERTAKQRLQALKSNDEEAYLKLLDQTKDTRITHLLRQTNSFLDSLSSAVRAQQGEAGTAMPMAAASGEDGEDGEEDREKIDYYHIAHRVKETVTKQPSILVGGQLKEYQLKGLQWMVSLYNNSLNGILADEMGLGKTIQSISLITYLIEVKRQTRPYLVIVPLSTLTNWTNEFEKWAPSVKKIVFKGSPNQRKELSNQVRAGDFQVLLTTYEYIIKDKALLGRIRWVHMIIDEGHRMKNTQSKLAQTLTQFYYSRYRLILTGTPLQNNLPELWALLNFVLPKIFNSVKTFDEWFNTPFANSGAQDKMELTEEETLLVIRRLHKVLRPFLLRRLKKDVEKDLPDKVETVIKCKMSALQLKMYQQMLKYNALYVGDESGAAGVNKSGVKGLNNKIMQLRKICNHPYVYEEVETLLNPSHGNNDLLWRSAGKFELLDRILPKFKARDHRVLMFFQMTQIMDIMEDYLRLRGLQYLRLDGNTKADDRSEMLKLFNAPDSPYFCFLLSTRAGGLGLNLQTADTVIIYDTDWNPHQDLQAQDRAHRIGQTKEVRILRLITEDSVEEVILQRAHAKLEIDGKVIQAGKFDNKSTAEEQEAFLRGLLEQEESKRGSREAEDEDLDDEELNDLLARNEEERGFYAQMDAERNATSDYGKGAGRPDRLLAENELPEQFTQDVSEHFREDDMADSDKYGRGARERKEVYYDDGLTEEQWLNIVDNDEDLDAAIKKRRRSRRARAATDLEDGMEVDEIIDDADGDDQFVDDEHSPPPKKKNKNKIPKVRETLSVADREELNESCQLALNECFALTEPWDPEDAAQGLRHVCDLFRAIPSKKLYPDYFKLIKNPIALDVIQKKVKQNVYQNRYDFVADFELMNQNARTYNEENSPVVTDADRLLDIARG